MNATKLLVKTTNGLAFGGTTDYIGSATICIDTPELKRHGADKTVRTRCQHKEVFRQLAHPNCKEACRKSRIL